MNQRFLNLAKLSTLVMMVGITFNYFSVMSGHFDVKAQVEDKEVGVQKVRICHRTAAHNHPYVSINVDADSVDGNTGNDKGKGDHYMEHVGPIWSEDIEQHVEWGDIIPPVEGDPGHLGLNWDDEGQAIWNNGCRVPGESEDDDVLGCVDEDAENYDPNANVEDNDSCIYVEDEICEDDTANNTGEELPCTYDPDPTTEPTEEPTPNSCPAEVSCPSYCGAGATDVANGSCGVKHCDPVHCSDNSSEERPIGGTSEGQVLGVTTDSYAATGVAEDILFSLVGLTGTGLSGLGILMRRNENK